MKKQYQKPSRYITFGSAWAATDEDDGSILRISCKTREKAHEKVNNGELYKVLLVKVDEDGDPTGEPFEIKNFVLFPSNMDKSKYKDSPDFNVSVGIVD